MKNRRLTALVLVSALTLFALVPAALAAKPGSNTEAAAQETQVQRYVRRGGCVKAEKSGKGTKTAEPENAVGKDAAREKALSDAGVTAEQAGKVKVHVSQLGDGTVVYKVCFTIDGTRYSYQIEAVSGAVVDKSTEAVTEDSAAAESRGHGKHGGKGGRSVDSVTGATDAAKSTPATV